MSDNDLQSYDFEHVDADAVCERCGTVNQEETFLCKSCGNNLRDQRRQRIAKDQGPELGGGTSRIRVFTGLLTALGILIIILALYRLPNIEEWLVQIQTGEASVSERELWQGADSAVYDQLVNELMNFPSRDAQIKEAIENPVDDISYNGRYALVQQGGILGTRILGEANLTKRSGKIFFVARLRRTDAEIRGYATIDDTGSTQTATESAAVRIEGQLYTAFGFAEKLSTGGHACYAQSFFDDRKFGVYAYRIR